MPQQTGFSTRLTPRFLKHALGMKPLGNASVCATAMSKKRDGHYLDTKPLAADVKRSLAHQPVSVYRTGAWKRLRLWRRRNPVVASLSQFLAVSLLKENCFHRFGW